MTALTFPSEYWFIAPLILNAFTRHKVVTIVFFILTRGLLMLPAFCDFFHLYLQNVTYYISTVTVSTAQYFGANIVLLSISTALTVLVLNIHHRGSRGNPVPAMVQMVVLDWLARILGMVKCVHGKNKRNPNNAKTVGINSNMILKR